MNLIREVLAELFGMFVADARLTAAVLLLVLAAAAVIHLLGAPPIVGGVVLLAGCLGLVILSVRAAAQYHARQH